MTKKWYQSKTILVAIATAAIGIITAFQTQYGEIGLLVTIKSVLDIFLRLETSTSVK